MSRDPFITVMTPVYNGEAFLAECIESVIAQSFGNFEYVILNNKSTDRTEDIARHYAASDPRIRLVTSNVFRGIIENHNAVFRLASARSEYFKIVSADDFLYPECLAKLVGAAENNPTVGIVGSYAIYDKGIRWLGLAPGTMVSSGHDICRKYLLGEIDAFGTPSAVLYRASIVRSQESFFPGSAPNADLAACLNCLAKWDFAFVHQVLSFERVHEEQLSSGLHKLNSFLLDRIEFVDKYGPIYLCADELCRRREQLLDEYYSDLAVAVCNFRNGAWWGYQRTRIHSLGYPVLGSRLVKALARKVADLAFNPKQTFEKILRRCMNEGAGAKQK